jgi:hypothetical protein
MSLINNHVHTSMVSSIKSNEWSLDGKDLSFGGFGLLPRFELTSVSTIVMQIEPKSGLLPLLFWWIGPKEPLQTRVTEGPSSWIRLNPWYWSLSRNVRGIYIQKERIDRFAIEHTISHGGLDQRLRYQVSIRATVEPKAFFTFLLNDEAGSMALLEILRNRISEVISSVLIDRANNPAFIHHCSIEDEILTRAGYKVEDCMIQYVASDNQQPTTYNL